MNKPRLSLAFLIVGAISLIASSTFLAFTLLAQPTPETATYLTQANSWVLEGADGVIWRFSEIGRGVLTTNHHQNDYDFLWSLDGDTLKIETAWAYPLQNTYTYKLDQKFGRLELKSGDKTITFIKSDQPFASEQTAPSPDPTE